MKRRFSARAGAAAAGVAADRFLGEPRIDPHPVAAFGSVMDRIEGVLWRDRRVPGVAHVAIGAGLGLLAGRVARTTAGATYLAVAGRSLGEAAINVRTALDAGDVQRARDLLPSLVGRDPHDLDEIEISRAVVESVAENTVDAIVAPALFACAGGAPGVLFLRAVNTMDAQIGHRSTRYERYGWAAARLDDISAWIPARTTAALVALVRPQAAAAVLGTVRSDAAAHPSPNAGVAEAAFAAALGVRLGGTNRYGEVEEQRPPLGDGRTCERSDIDRAVRLSRDVSIALTAVLAAPLAIRAGRSARRLVRR